MEATPRKPEPFCPPPLAFAGRLVGRLERPLPIERVAQRPSMEDRPVYQRLRALLRRTGRLRPRSGSPRSLERPDEVDRHLEECCPQFFLRNIGRVERPEEEVLPFETQAFRDAQAEEALRSLRNLRYRPPQLLDRMNLDEVLWLRAMLRRVIYQEDWRRRFGRELKQHVRGPLFRYDPDAPTEETPP